MSDGRETRAAIDTETVRGLLLINGGGAVALLAFLPALLQHAEFAQLSRSTIFAIFSFQCGLMFAVVHNRLRGLCSLQYVKKKENRSPCSLFGMKSEKPCVCLWSRGFMWASIGAFFVAGIVMLCAGLNHINQVENGFIGAVIEAPNNELQPTANASVE